MQKVNLGEKLATFTDQWKPKVVGELNGQMVKLVKFQGPFVWHHHDHEDEFSWSSRAASAWSSGIGMSGSKRERF